jgi:D-alanyl-D-alanine carboxypeptidase/D-alanyl-D-alanine carboxypeptidase (penicillin-binding protein 5/6)
MMMSSGNDAANAAAVRIAKSQEAFVDMMNERARLLGMNNTLFCTPSGLEASGEPYSTAYDMALLAQEALSNDDFCEMVSSKSVELYYGNPPYHRWLTNHNRLLWQYEDCIGIKTRLYQQGGRCLVTAARRDGLTLIAVT